MLKQLMNLKQMNNVQLQTRLRDIGNDLMRALGATKAGGAYSKDSMFIRKLKREKAQIKTLLREREIFED